MLVTFEGIDGSGKSTQARLLVERLEAAGYATLLVREPGGTELSERVRDVLLTPELHVVPMAELLLFSASRAQLVAERIRPALASGYVVVCDRFYDSTVAYQGSGRQLEDLAWLMSLNERVTGGLVPDRTYLVDVSLEAALTRRQAYPHDRMEAGDHAFYERVLDGYHRLADQAPARVRRIDGHAPIEVVHAAIWADLQPLLEPPAGTTPTSNGSP